jgi:hypothetical protein
VSLLTLYATTIEYAMLRLLSIESLSTSRELLDVRSSLAVEEICVIDCMEASDIGLSKQRLGFAARENVEFPAFKFNTAGTRARVSGRGMPTYLKSLLDTDA